MRNFEYNGERSRGLTILKSRGIHHSNQIREFTLSDRGVDLIDPYIGPEGVFMGSAKTMQEAKDNARLLNLRREVRHKRDLIEEKLAEYEANLNALKAQHKADESDLKKSLEIVEQDLEILLKDREIMSRERKQEAKKKK